MKAGLCLQLAEEGILLDVLLLSIRRSPGLPGEQEAPTTSTRTSSPLRGAGVGGEGAAGKRLTVTGSFGTDQVRQITENRTSLGFHLFDLELIPPRTQEVSTPTCVEP